MSDYVPQREVYVLKDHRQQAHLRTFQSYPLYKRETDGAWVGDGTELVFVPRSQVHYAVKTYDANMRPADAPKVLLCYLHRPVCVGAQLKAGFRLVGCAVRSAGPESPHSWGRPCAASDYDPPDYEMADGLWDVNHVIQLCGAAGGWVPDVVVMVDHQDDFRLIGEAYGGTKFVYIAVENWDETQHALTRRRRADLEFYCVRHWQSVAVDGERITMADRPGESPPLATNAQLFVFPADTTTRPFLGLPRDKAICQIGVGYEPRYRIWNRLREMLDRQPPLGADEWNRLSEPAVTTRTAFGFCLRHRDQARIYNTTVATISSSNVDYVPNRVPDAFATGCILLSDDVPTMRATWGAPWPENPDGIWVAHERTTESIYERSQMVLSQPEAQTQIRARALLTVLSAHTYAHRARMILGQLGIEPVGRLL